MNLGEALTYGTARLAMLLYLVGLALRLHPHRFQRNLSRAVWTVGCAIFLLHVVCAFQFVHHWSHADAYAATARRTAGFIGAEWGGGLYLNYAFTLIWIADVCWFWSESPSYEARPRWVAWSVHGFMGFLAFQATVVFADGLPRWLFLTAWLLLAAASVQSLRQRTAAPSNETRDA
jgi:hypothetical protein